MFKYTIEDIERIKQESDIMFPKEWSKMYFGEQQKALKRDRKYNYVHILFIINDDISKKHDEMWNKYKQAIDEVKKEYEKPYRNSYINIMLMGRMLWLLQQKYNINQKDFEKIQKNANSWLEKIDKKYKDCCEQENLVGGWITIVKD